MTKAQRTLIGIQGRQSELRSRLAVLAAQDTRTADEETELTTVETKLSGCEPELRAALAAAAAEDDSARTVQTTDAEGRERLELRAKTGLADFLKAAAGGAAVTGAAAEYAASLGVPATGHLPMALFAPTVPTVETRAVTPGPAVKGMLQPTVPFVFERSAAASLGIMMPTVPSGQVQIPKITTAPPADTLAKDGAAPADGCGGHAGQSGSGPNRRKFRGSRRGSGRHADAGIGAQLSRCKARMSNELDESTFNGAAGELNGLCSSKRRTSMRRGPSRPIRRASVASRRWWTGDTPIPSLMCGPSSAPIRSRSTPGVFANTNKGDVSPVRLPHSDAGLDSGE